MMEKLRFYDFARACHVKRWHIIHTVREQTLAEHSFLVTIIALELFRKIVGCEDHVDINTLMVGAMFHDMPEIRTGDTPTPAKATIREMGGDEIFTKIDEALMPELPYVGGQVPDRLKPFIKMADLIADAWWITENKAGIHSGMVAQANSRTMADFVINLETAYPKVGWLKAVNEILMELGMPYISHALKLTPP